MASHLTRNSETAAQATGSGFCDLMKAILTKEHHLHHTGVWRNRNHS